MLERLSERRRKAIARFWSVAKRLERDIRASLGGEGGILEYRCNANAGCRNVCWNAASKEGCWSVTTRGRDIKMSLQSGDEMPERRCKA